MLGCARFCAHLALESWVLGAAESLIVLQAGCCFFASLNRLLVVGLQQAA